MNRQTVSHSVAVLELFSHILLEYHLEYKTSKKNWKSVAFKYQLPDQ